MRPFQLKSEEVSISKSYVLLRMSSAQTKSILKLNTGFENQKANPMEHHNVWGFFFSMLCRYFIWITKVLGYCKLNSKSDPFRIKRITHVQINNPIYIPFLGGFIQKTWIFSDYTLINTSPVGITTKNESLYKETETTS